MLQQKRNACLEIIYADLGERRPSKPEHSTILSTASLIMQLLTDQDKSIQTAPCSIDVMQHAVVLPPRGLTRPRWLQKRRDRALETTLA